MKKIKTKPYKVPATWWVGWIAFIPLRLFGLAIMMLWALFIPSLFYGLVSANDERDQSKWRMD